MKEKLKQPIIAVFRNVQDALGPQITQLLGSLPLQPATAKYHQLQEQLEDALINLTPIQLIVATVSVVLVLQYTLRCLVQARRHIQQHGLLALAMHFVLSLPIIRGRVAKEKSKLIKKLASDVRTASDDPHDEPFSTLPEHGVSADDVRQRLQYKQRKCVVVADGKSTISGTVYLAGEEHRALMMEAYQAFDLANPMHANIYPSVRRMEAEVVAMTASLLGGGPNGDPNVCGAMTSGGSESILSAMKASRDYMRQNRGITDPEMIIAVSAHAAYYKAAEYFGFRLVRVPVGHDFRLSARTVSQHITSNTAIVVASAPGYPHGVVDHVGDIAKVTRRRGILLHVDACLGGLVMPFARALGYPTVDFDFRVPGVTSMSVDTHKFGMAHKGTSVVLYRSKLLRRFQYTRITDWTGGLYISPGFAGSRNGALIATAWASMVHLGWDGYSRITDNIMKTAWKFRDAIRDIPQLQLPGEPDSCVVGLMASKKAAAKGFNMYKLNDLLTQRGWHLSSLQHPPALHMCFTAAHIDSVDQLCKDLRECCDWLSSNPNAAPDGSAPFYGLAATMPDRRLVGDFLEAFQDALLSL